MLRWYAVLMATVANRAMSGKRGKVHLQPAMALPVVAAAEAVAAGPAQSSPVL
jgi:hypothetical protein